MPMFKVTVTVHSDFVIDQVEADTAEEAKKMVENDMCDYLPGANEEYSYSEVIDVETM